jgi:RNA polymerase sigma-70 factor (ECF subfamily)
MEQEEIAELIARCGLGDRAAFRRLYDLTASKLHGVTLRILGGRAEAEEALQEAYVKIWHNAGRYQAGRGSPVGWMVSIARNQAIDLLRARRVAPRDVAEMTDLPAPGPGPEAAAMMADDRRRLEACLGGLAPERAAAVRAAYMEGHTYEDLARRHAVPLNTMRTWLRRSLISLRECLGR